MGLDQALEPQKMPGGREQVREGFREERGRKAVGAESQMEAWWKGCLAQTPTPTPAPTLVGLPQSLAWPCRFPYLPTPSCLPAGWTAATGFWAYAPSTGMGEGMGWGLASEPQGFGPWWRQSPEAPTPHPLLPFLSPFSAPVMKKWAVGPAAKPLSETCLQPALPKGGQLSLPHPNIATTISSNSNNEESYHYRAHHLWRAGRPCVEWPFNNIWGGFLWLYPFSRQRN